MLLRNENSKSTAFTSVYQHTHQKLYAVFINICQDKELTKDILQKTYQVLWEKWETIQDKENLFSYLLTVAKNLFFDHYRKSSKYKQIIRHIKQYSSVNATEADQVYLRKECAQTITGLIKQLPAKRKMATQLYLEAGLSRLEIARQMNVSPNTIDNQLQKALKFLQKEMKAYAGGGSN